MANLPPLTSRDINLLKSKELVIEESESRRRSEKERKKENGI
jgi:hypothetical protein